MNLEQSDRLQTVIAKPYSGKEDHRKAYAYLRRRHAEGTLLPVHDWAGDTVAAYADILGIKP